MEQRREGTVDDWAGRRQQVEAGRQAGRSAGSGAQWRRCACSERPSCRGSGPGMRAPGVQVWAACVRGSTTAGAAAASSISLPPACPPPLPPPPHRPPAPGYQGAYGGRRASRLQHASSTRGSWFCRALPPPAEHCILWSCRCTRFLRQQHAPAPGNCAGCCAHYRLHSTPRAHPEKKTLPVRMPTACHPGCVQLPDTTHAYLDPQLGWLVGPGQQAGCQLRRAPGPGFGRSLSPS